MATVTLNSTTPTKPRLKYADLKHGQYIIDNEGFIFAIIYNGTTPSRPIIASVTNTSNTYTGYLPSEERTYRILEQGENFTVTI